MEKIIQDIRIVSLYKQHYFDSYNPDMDAQYSCWGYYDGINVKSIDIEDEENKSSLFKKRSQACISPVWCGTVHNAETLNGTYSKQNIGIFRCVEAKNKEYWQMELKLQKSSPYFSLVFLQLKNRTQYSLLETSIPKISISDIDVSMPYVSFSTYHTYDNADLVVLLYSNSIQELGCALENLEKSEYVQYIHSIIGVSEAFLQACSHNIQPYWNAVNCFVNNVVPHVTMKISTSGDPQTPGKLRYQLDELSKQIDGGFSGLKHTTFSQGTGHCNLRIDIANITVKTLLSMITKNGIATHDNPLFGKEIYNIETILSLNSVKIRDITSVSPKKNQKGDTSTSGNIQKYFAKLTMKYAQKTKDAWNQHDEGVFSYYAALTQVCNILTQYEGFTLSKDIFLLLYPAFRMFEHQLDTAEQAKGTGSSPEQTQALMDSICEFVNAVNSVVYHTIHTDQIFLMIPGYSGTTFSIPVKLCLIYMWIIQKVIGLLNDAGYKYACLLTPELETRPATTLINMGLSSDDRLIRFSSSQRSLYMPRHFIILITHELAHYVGKSIRIRNSRLQSISRVLAQLLGQGIFPEEYCQIAENSTDPVRRRLYQIMKATVKEQIEITCVSAIYHHVENNSDPRKEHAIKAVPALKKICYELLGENGIIYQSIYSLPSVLGENFKDEELTEALNLMCDLQNRLDYNRRCLFASRDIIDSCIDELMQLFREVFSDVAAYVILDFDMETFSEVFNVSEGTCTSDNSDYQRKARKQIIQRLEGTTADPEEEDATMCHQNLLVNWPYSIKDKLYSYTWVGKYLWEYAEEAASAVKRQIRSKSADVQLLQATYKLFTDNETSCNKIYEHIVHIIEEYSTEISSS